MARAGREPRTRGRLLTLDSASAPTARWHRGVTAGPVPAASPAPQRSTCHRVPPPTWQPFKHGGGARKITCEASGDTLPGVFLWPVISASPLTGCSQVVLLASSLWRDRQTGGKTETERGDRSLKTRRFAARWGNKSGRRL